MCFERFYDICATIDYTSDSFTWNAQTRLENTITVSMKCVCRHNNVFGLNSPLEWMQRVTFPVNAKFVQFELARIKKWAEQMETNWETVLSVGGGRQAFQTRFCVLNSNCVFSFSNFIIYFYSRVSRLVHFTSAREYETNASYITGDLPSNHFVNKSSKILILGTQCWRSIYHVLHLLYIYIKL